MNHCPEPVYIYVDPDGGYACGASVDPATLAAAWQEQCESLRRPTPGGPNPCGPPDVDHEGRWVRPASGRHFDPCADIAARIDPESPECAGTVTVGEFGKIDAQQLLVFGLNELGGPTFVIPVGPRGGDDDPHPGRPTP